MSSLSASAYALPSSFRPLLFDMDVPDTLLGHAGTNRGGECDARIKVNNDVEAVQLWLSQFANSPNTLACTRRESERLLMWAIKARKKSLSSLSRDDLSAYCSFMSDPQPADVWQMSTGKRLGRQDPQWRPFGGPLSPVSVRQAVMTLRSMFAWLCQIGYLKENPLSTELNLSPSYARSRSTGTLTPELLADVRETISDMPQATRRQQGIYWRARWVFCLLSATGIQISDAVNNRMDCFSLVRSTDAREQTWVALIRDSMGRSKKVPVPDFVIEELCRYRTWLGLPAQRQPDEDAPLVFPASWSAPKRGLMYWPEPLTRAALHVAIKDIFTLTASRLGKMGDAERARAASLEAASAQCLRYFSRKHGAQHACTWND